MIYGLSELSEVCDNKLASHKMETPAGKADRPRDHDSEQSQDNVVSWEGEDDPTNPLNWSPLAKWVHVAIISIGTFTM